MEISQPNKYCEKCGEIIPANGDQIDAFGHPILDEKGKMIFEPKALLACKGCAIKASENMPRKQRYRPLESEKQESFLVDYLPVLRLR